MIAQTPHPQPASDDVSCAAGDFARPVLDEQLAGLRRLANLGLGIAEDIKQLSGDAVAQRKAGAASAEASAKTAAVIDLGFARVSRAIRLTYALQNQVLEQLRRVGHIEEAQAASAGRERAELSHARKVTVAKVLSRIIRDEICRGEDGDADPKVDPGAEAAAGSDEAAESDRSEACERETRETHERLIREGGECLKEHDRFGDWTSRPLSEAIAHICRDLGITPDWLHLSEEAWAQEELRSGQVGAALAALPPGPRAPGPLRRPFRTRLPVKKPTPVARPPSFEARSDAAAPPIEATRSDAPPPAAPSPAAVRSPPPPSPARLRRDEEDAIARRFALPGELPPPRRPGRRYWDD
jgi:hypothetical protein